jgi:Asp-tRNA(Asn)/Glu-tRNA(Gln) amidotransferase C subunit
MVNKEEIQKQAKKIMDDFVKELDKISQLKEFGLERDEFSRKPSNTYFNNNSEENKDFKNRILKNAPKTKDGCIQAEKKHW